jgi:hypothetical protein
MKDEVLKLALEALDNLLYWDNGKSDYDQAREAITAIKQALAAPVQEPVVMPENWFAGMPEEYRKEAWRVATPPAAQPAVPDAIHHPDLSEHPQYIEGWNDCRAEMLKGMKP